MIEASSFSLASKSKKTSELFELCLEILGAALKFVQMELFGGVTHDFLLTRARIKNNRDKVKHR